MVWVVLLIIALVLLAVLAAVVFTVRALFRRSIPQLAIVAACVGTLYVAYKLNYPDYSYRYRMQFSVLADEKEHTGTSVIEVRWRGEPSVDPSRFLVYNAAGSVHGQAPLIDFGDRGILLAAFAGPYEGREWGMGQLWIGGRAFGNEGSPSQLAKLPLLTGKRDLKPDNLPMLVWLPDRSDPKSAQRLHPSEIDRIVPGAKLLGVSVEITSDRVVVDMNKRFPWFDAWVQDWENRRRGVLTTRPGEFLFTPYRLVGDS